MNKVSKKITAIFIALTFVLSSFIGVNQVFADENFDYLINGKESYIGGEMVVYSESGLITEESEIVYTTEDGESISFKAVAGEEGKFYFLITADKAGVWTASTIDGTELSNDYLNFTVYNSQEEMAANYDVEIEEQVEEEAPRARSFSAPASSASGTVTRHSGSDRFQTAVEVSKNNFRTSQNVVVASGVDYPDALSAVSLAKQLNSPILFVNTDSVPSSTSAEIKRLGAKKAYIIGGTGSVSNNALNQLKNLTGNTERISGVSRQETAMKVAEKTKTISPVNTVILVAGDNYADALSAGPVSGKNVYPILFTNTSSAEGIDGNTKAFISRTASKVVIVGGTGSVTTAAENALKRAGKTVERVSGPDRYSTSLEVANKYFGSTKKAYMASGENFADALAGGAVGAKDAAPMYLVRGNAVATPLQSNIKSKGVSDANILGGPGSVSTGFESSLVNTLGGGSKPQEESVRNKVVAEARKHIGKPYVYGSAGPNSFDCSGLVKYVYKASAGRDLYHQAATQATYGKYVAKASMKPGDLIFFNGYTSRITHVGIYTGNGMMVHSPAPGQKVCEVSINSNYYVKTYHTSRNLLD